MSEHTIAAFVAERNRAKRLFTAGPASLLAANITGLRPCFGRGDADYDAVEARVLDALKAMSGHRHIARMQGSASLALEIMAVNFLFGRVLVIQTGYYAARVTAFAEIAQRTVGAVTAVTPVPWQEMDAVSGAFDWVVACPTETSCALKLPIADLRRLADRLNARLMLDATGSIGLEDGHEMADAIAYSSCKGLFGLTGAAFVAFNDAPTAQPDSFYLDLRTHLDKRMTGPYHAIASLADVLPRHADFREAVVTNKRVFCARMASRLTVPADHQPLLCTHVDGEIGAAADDVVLYTPRSDRGGSVVCHLGEVHLGRAAQGDILNALQVRDAP